jgi:DNA-binding transcriptional MerR regulator
MKIGELADRLGVTTKTIRFYESIGLLPEPARTPSGYRDYEAPDTERLTFIKTAQRLGLSLDEIREVIAFRDRGEQPCAYVAELLGLQVRQLDTRIREMRALRDELRDLEARASAGGSAAGNYCGVIEHVRHLPTSARAGPLDTAVRVGQQQLVGDRGDPRVQDPHGDDRQRRTSELGEDEGDH